MLPIVDIWSLLVKARAEHGSRCAVIDGPRRLTYADLAARVAALGRYLRARGLGAGDRIAILDVNSTAFLEAYFATAGIGAILNPLNHRLAAPELREILADAGARWLLAGERFAATAAALLGGDTPLQGQLAAAGYEDALAAHAGDLDPVPVAPDDVAHLYYTSGTTGRPKGVMLTHRNVCVHAAAAVTELSLTAQDVWGHIAPMFHLADAWACFALTQVGGTHVIVPVFDAAAVLAAIQEHGITISNLIPTMLNLMVKHPRVREHDTASLRLVLSGGAPIAPEVVRLIVETLGGEYVQTYGMTETSPYLTLSLLPAHLRALPAEQRLAYQARTGRPFAGVELKVARDAQGTPVAADDHEVGEIWVRGETVTPGYWNQPAATAAAFTADGFLKTGDLAVLDGEGFVNIVDRKKDMIITGGENVYSIEVENALYQHPAVLEAAVIGLPDARWGEAVTAAVVLRPGHTADAAALVAFCRERIAAYKTPRMVHLLPELPRTGSGKIAKRVLRERLG